MPGIAGIISSKPTEIVEGDLAVMLEAMRHEKFYRGGQYINRDLKLCVGWMNQEASFSDCMPLVNDRRDTYLVFQGEHYVDDNSPSPPQHSGNGTDDWSAQSLLTLYEEARDDFFCRLNGWFCGVVIDLRGQRITLFNDRYGMGRLYTHESPNEFLFASEAKALLKVRPALREIRPEGLAEYLRYNCVTRNKTLFKDIDLLPNGSSWVFENSVRPKKKRYFNPTDWEEQSPIPAKDFYKTFEQTVTRVFPRYLRGGQKVALALTAGLDTRVIAAAFRAQGLSLPSYTFGGTWGETLDIQKARRIAAICHQPYQTINIGSAFFREFPNYAQKGVYLSDGMHDAFGAHDIYLNQIAREIAPVRLTGKFGSEVVKNRRLIPWYNYPNYFIHPDFKPVLNRLQPRDRTMQKDSLSKTVFEEIPWYESGRVAIEQSQLTLRTPYLDNDLVKLMFQAPPQVRAVGQIQKDYVRAKTPELSGIMTNLGDLGDTGPFVTKLRRAFYRVLFKTEYIYLYAAPHWLTWLDRRLEKLAPERFIAGREKFEGYRIWIKSELSEFVRQTLLNPGAQYARFLNRKCVEKMVVGHTAGTHNYLNEITKALTIELIHKSLLAPA